MNKYFDEFLIKNNIKIYPKTNSKNFLCVDRGRLNQVLLNSFFSVLINRKFKFNPIILCDLKNKKTIKLYKSFGFNNFLIGFRFFLFFTHTLILQLTDSPGNSSITLRHKQPLLLFLFSPK